MGYIFEGEWAVSTPKGAATETILQYDGADETMDLNTNGLGSIDLTDGGLGLSFRFSIISDIETVYSIAIYSPNNGVCTADVLFPGIVGTDYDLEDTIVDLSFEDLDGNCDLESVGALELLISGEDAIDAILRTVEIVGLDDPVEPSPSPTRTPQPSASRPPSPTPAPAAGFTWYTFDDDDNGRSPCGDEPDRRTYWSAMTTSSTTTSSVETNETWLLLTTLLLLPPLWLLASALLLPCSSNQYNCLTIIYKMIIKS